MQGRARRSFTQGIESPRGGWGAEGARGPVLVPCEPACSARPGLRCQLQRARPAALGGLGVDMRSPGVGAEEQRRPGVCTGQSEVVRRPASGKPAARFTGPYST